MHLTLWIILITMVLWGVWTGVAHKFGQKAISPTIRNVAWRFSSFAMLWGVLLSHWLIPGFGISHRVGSTLPFLVGTLAFDLGIHPKGKPWWKYPGLWFGLGLIVGTLFWGQRV